MIENLVIGASGMVGENLLQQLYRLDRNSAGTYWKHNRADLLQLDIRDNTSVQTLITQLRPRIVYLPAALTNVDECERHPLETSAINVNGSKNVIDAVNMIGGKFIYFSSDYIFNGENGPYREEDPASPICEYGKQKWQVEQMIKDQLQNYLILRTTIVYGWESQGKNFIQRLINNLRAGISVRVPIDQLGSPTYAPNLAEAAVELAKSKYIGIYNLVGPQLVNRYDFALEAARVFGLDEKLIQSVSTTNLNQPASRPLHAGMIPSKAQAVLKTKLLAYPEGLRCMAAICMEGSYGN